MVSLIFRILPAVLVCVVLVCLPSSGPAQDQFQYRQRLTKASGLPNDDVIVITQDHQGFMWFGTTAGLARYDGAQITVFVHDPADTNSLVDNWIRDVEPIGNALWIGTTRGISVLDLDTETFHNYYLDQDGGKMSGRDESAGGASLIYHDRLGVTWIAGREEREIGWCRYDSAAETFTCYGLDPAELKYDLPSAMRINNVLTMHRDNAMDSILWVGTAAGLIRFNTVTRQKRHFYFPLESKRFEVHYNAFRRMWQAPDGRLFCGSWSGGLNIFDPKSESYGPAPYDNPDLPGAFFQSIREISQKSDTEIWVTLFKSLIAYDFVAGRITMRLESDFATDEMYGADFIDRDGRIWSRLHGVHLFDPRLQQFNYASFHHLNPDGEGFTYGVIRDALRQRLTVISRDCDGLYHYDPLGRSWEKTAFPPEIYSVPRFEGNNAVMQPDGQMLISAFHEIFRYDPASGKMDLPDITFPVRLKAFNRIALDRQGHVWFGTHGDGAVRWHLQSGAITHLLADIRHHSISGGVAVRCIDSRDNAWITNKPDLYLYRSNTDALVNLCELDTRYCEVTGAVEDDLGRVWLLKDEGQVVLADITAPEQGVDTVLTLGTRNELLYALHKDGDGQIWGFFKSQLVKVNPATFATERFNTEYLQDYHEISSSHIVDGHTLVLGLANAIILIDLRELRPNTEQPEPYISQIDVREVPLQAPVVPRKLQRLDLRHNENFFSISFSALGYTLSNENVFQYRLTPFEENWRDAADRRFANYTNVPSGRYVFELRVFNSEGQMSPHHVTLPVVIARHWSERLGVRVLALLMLLGVVYGLYRWRIGQIRKQEALKSQFKTQLAETEMTALRAQMNPHFIFNCLNSIESFIVRNDPVNASIYLSDFARLIRLILQNSGSKFVPLSDELEALHLYLKMESLRFKGRFHYEIVVAPEIDPANVQFPPMVLQPFVENAILHGLLPKKEVGNVRIDIRPVGQVLHCTIEDDGIGRARSAELKQSGTAARRKSMGMAITKDRIALLNAVHGVNTEVTISDVSGPGGEVAGTRVELRIPV
ncbi:MAG: histidine kinase [Saprospiraceae bacterium]|nr:histidine kinase [Saprospiraceae bacterium]